MSRSPFLYFSAVFFFAANLQSSGAQTPPTVEPVLQFERGPFSRAAFVEGTDLIVTQGDSGVFVWSTTDGSLVRELDDYRNGAREFCLSTNGQRCAWLINSGKVRVYETMTGNWKEFGEEDAHGSSHYVSGAPSLSPDGRLLGFSRWTYWYYPSMFSSSQGWVYDIATSTVVKSLGGGSMVFAPDSKRLFQSTWPFRIDWSASPARALICDLQTNESVALSTENTDVSFSPGVFSADSNRVATSILTDVWIRDARNGAIVWEFRPPESNPGAPLGFLNDNVSLILAEDAAATGTPGFLHASLYDTDARRLVRDFGAVNLRLFDYGAFLSVQTAEKPDEYRLYSSGDLDTPVFVAEGEILAHDYSSRLALVAGDLHYQIVNTRTNEIQASLSAMARGAVHSAIRPDSTVAALAFEGGWMRQYSIPSGVAMSEWKTPGVEFHSLQYRADGSLLAGTNSGGGLVIDADSGEIARTLRSGPAFATPTLCLDFPEISSIAFVHQVPGGSSASCDGGIWDAETGAVLYTFDTGLKSIESFNSSPDGRHAVAMGERLVSSDSYNRFDAVIVDCYSGQVIWKLPNGIRSEYASIATFDPTGKSIILTESSTPPGGSSKAQVIDWQTSSISTNSKFPLYEVAGRIAWLADRKHVIVYQDENVTLWEETLGRQRYFGRLGYSYGKGQPLTPVVSPNGKYLLYTQSKGGPALLWETGLLIAPPVPLRGDVNGDGVVTPIDAQSAFECYINGACSPPNKAAAADYCGDGSVTPSDAQSIFEAFLGLASSCN